MLTHHGAATHLLPNLQEDEGMLRETLENLYRSPFGREIHALCWPWRPARDRTIQVKAERLMATTGQLFEELMATFHTLGMADPPLELHVLDVPGAHCLTVFTKGNVATSRKQVAPALVTFFEKAERC